MLTVNELFSGIGSQSAALERLGIGFKVVGIAEIDKYAIKSYKAIHGETRNYGDISVIEKLDYADFWTYSFPCQDISVAGNQKGIKEGTRSGLLYEVERLLYKSIMFNEQPKYLMLENVKNLVGKKFKPQFDEWLEKLNQLGYNTYWKALNAKNYGIPQNRERVFAISIRKDIDIGYEFPIGFDNGKRLKDILEMVVDEKFYLSNDKVNLFMKQGNVNPSGRGMNGNVSTENICNTLTTNKGEGLKIGIDKSINNTKAIEYANCLTAREDRGISNRKSEGTALLELPCIAASRGRNLENPSDRTPGNEVEQRLELNKNGTSNTITTVQKDNYVIETNIPFVDKKYKQFQDKNGYIPEMFNPYHCTKINEFAPTQLAQGDSVTKSSTVLLYSNFRIRKLTPLECWRLMGFTDEQFYKAEQVNSNSQLYKQAGNSIVVDVLYYIFKEIFKSKTQKENNYEMEIMQ